MPHAPIVPFFRSYLRDLSESLFVRSAIDSAKCDRIRAFTRKAECARYAEELRRHHSITIPQLNLSLRLKHLREITGREFYHIEIIVNRHRRRRRRVCFVGHRFTPSIGRTLRWNLRQVLEPYNIELDWSGADARSVQIFEDIVRRIKRADFCVFETRATRGRPNVYIEAGIAYAVDTPFVLFDYVSPGAGGPGASLPSDLAHAMSLRYSSYQQLFREFYVALPVFAARNL
ncbi:MAG: hypothetical protein ACRD26_16825 [Vicinamibacterales bacterium]